MKRYIPFLVLILFTLLTGCEEHTPQDHYISVIIDRSEIDSYKPETDEIINYLSYAHPTDAITLSLSYISDTQYASKYSFTLGKSEVGWLSNEDKRRKTRRVFFKQFEDSLHFYNQQQKPLQRSDILRVVARELQDASRQETEVDILLFSDLKEHSSLFSVYGSKHKQQFLHRTDTTIKRIISQLTLPENLSGVTLQIIYEPSIEEAPIFTAMVLMYKNLIEPRGGKVVVGRHTKIERL